MHGTGHFVYGLPACSRPAPIGRPGASVSFARVGVGGPWHQKATVTKARPAAFTDDDMVDDCDAEKSTGLDEAMCKEVVFPARRRIAAQMVVG